MGMTSLGNIDSTTARAKIVASLPTAPTTYYGFTVGQELGATSWVGGELAYLSTNDKLYIQTATSGSTATWRYLNDAFASTTSSSTSTSTSSTSSSTTSTSTSTSSSTSTSTSTSSTTTAA